MLKIKGLRLINRHKEILIDLCLYVTFFTLGFVYYMDLHASKESELFIYKGVYKKEITSSENEKISVHKNDSQYDNFNFVASSRGKYFYPIDCPRAKSLSDKNKIFFDTIDEAQKSGYKEFKC